LHLYSPFHEQRQEWQKRWQRELQLSVKLQEVSCWEKGQSYGKSPWLTTKCWFNGGLMLV